MPNDKEVSRSGGPGGLAGQAGGAAAQLGSPRGSWPPMVAGPGPGEARPAEPRLRASSLEGDELPETYGVDEVELIAKDPAWYFVYWEITDAGLAAARAQLGTPAGSEKQVLRIFLTASHTGAGGRESVQREIRDVPLTQRHGKKYLEVPRHLQGGPSATGSGGTLIRAAIGLLTPEGYFAPLANSSLLRMPPHVPASEPASEWLHVQPPRGGPGRERIVKSSSGPHSERGVPWRMRGEAGGDDDLLLDAPLHGDRALDSGFGPRSGRSAAIEVPPPAIGSGSGQGFGGERP